MDELANRLRLAGCVFAEAEAELLLAATDDPAEREGLIARRIAGEPLEYVLGWAQFAGLRLRTAPGVFVPRRRSELLVAAGLATLPPEAAVVDLCCGAGALAAAILAARPDVRVWAVDLDPDAVTVARENIPGADVLHGDLFDPLPPRLAGRIDLLVVNAPYVPTDQISRMPPEAREHEHRMALDGGADGLDVHRRVILGAGAWLAPAGRLVVETSRVQSQRDAAFAAAQGLSPSIVHDDEIGATALVAHRRPHGSSHRT